MYGYYFMTVVSINRTDIKVLYKIHIYIHIYIYVSFFQIFRDIVLQLSSIETQYYNVY